MSTPDSIRVQPGAANYFSHPGALDRIEQFHPAGTLQRVLWIGGKRAQAAAAPYLPALFNAPCSVRETFSGHCSEGVVSRYVGLGQDALGTLQVHADDLHLAAIDAKASQRIAGLR